MNKTKILVADDDEYIRNMTTRFFEGRGFEITTVKNGQEAVNKEEEIRPDLVILDVEMPVMNGLEACKIIRKKRSGINYIPVLFVSGILSEGAIVAGLELGADDYIRKPFELLELLTRVNNFLKMKKFIEHVEALENVIYSMVKSIEERDFYTAGHSRRVAGIATNIGREFGFSENEIENLYLSSLLHDVGKIGISDLILNKPGKLTDEEFNIIKKHPVCGKNICGSLRLTQHALDIIIHHHEKMDGSGYPDGLKGEEISKYVRIVTVADMFDALTTNRPYHKSRTNEEAISILEQEVREGKLDMDIVNYMKKTVG